MGKNVSVAEIQEVINWNKSNNPDFKENDISDGYHTFEELYEFRKLYNAALFNEWASEFMTDLQDSLVNGTVVTSNPKYDVHKSKQWQPGIGENYISDKGWFIVMAELPTGQISNHYKMEDWVLFNVPIKDKCNKYDGHSGKDVLKRLKGLT